jgi:tetratricopeptide (TPR) repeat protein
LAIDLEQSPFIGTLPDSRVNQTLKMMERSPGDRLTSEVAREICLRTSSKALLTGSLASVGSHYLLQLRVGNCQTGETLAADQAEAESREKVLQRLGEAAARVRSKLGESLASVRKYDRPLEDVTTPSLEALQAYSEGVTAWDEKGDAAAVPFFKRAVELDPNFAAAYNFLHWCYGNQGDAKLSMESMRRAYLLRDHLVEPEKYFTSAWYYSSVTGEIPKAIEQLQILLQEYPKHRDVHGALGNQYQILGQHEKAAAEFSEEVRRFPSDINGYNLFYDDLAMNRLEEARAVLNQGFSRMPEHPWLHQMSYTLAFLQNDDTTMQQQLNWARGTPALESQALGLDANTQTYHGRLAKGRKVLQAARDSANREGLGDAVALFHAGNALVEAEFGNHDRARQAARSAVAGSSDRLVRAAAGLALATAGDLAGAQQQLDFLNHEFPLNTLVKNYWVPAIQAQIELRKGHASRAIELLQLAAPYELSDEGAMYPVFARGQAYIASGDGAAAAAEFQQILGHRGLVANDAVGALAHLYVGRARALEAQSLRDEAADKAKTQARTAYQDFFNLWKDADRDIPILRQAEAEYTKLQ